MAEIWKAVLGYEGYIEASDYGHVRSLPRVVRKRNRWGQEMSQIYGLRYLAAWVDQNGYARVRFGIDRKKYTMYVHRLVALAFYGAPKDGEECCHNNGDPGDNRSVNLRWDTHPANNADRKAHGNYAVGLDHHWARHSAAIVGGIVSGAITRKQALVAGVSASQFHRLRKRTPEWFITNYGRGI